nr:hypothetical protein CFP56_65476 [Quercus suber]
MSTTEALHNAPPTATATRPRMAAGESVTPAILTTTVAPAVPPTAIVPAVRLALAASMPRTVVATPASPSKAAPPRSATQREISSPWSLAAPRLRSPRRRKP